VTPVNLTTGKAAEALPVGTYTYPTAITLSGATAIVVEPHGDSISLIDTRTIHVYAPIPVGAFPGAVTVTGAASLERRPAPRPPGERPAPHGAVCPDYATPPP
jgi:YVTN family beta-propeller protein